jgi:hypothetical protein
LVLADRRDGQRAHVEHHAIIDDLEREALGKASQIRSSLGSPIPSRSTSRVARCGWPVHSVNSVAPF